MTICPVRDSAGRVVYRAYQGEQDLVHIVSLVDDELSEPYNLYTYRYFLDTWPHLCFFAFSMPKEGEQEGEPLGVIISKLEPHPKCSSRSLVKIRSIEEERRWLSAGGTQPVDDDDDSSSGSEDQGRIPTPRQGGDSGDTTTTLTPGSRRRKKRCRMRGYLAMLSVRKDARGKGIATHLLRLSLTMMLRTPPSSSAPRPPDIATSSASHPGTEPEQAADPRLEPGEVDAEEETRPFSFPPDEIVLETESDNVEALSFYRKMGFVREKELYRFYLNGKRAARLKLDLTKEVLGAISGEPGSGNRIEEKP